MIWAEVSFRFPKVVYYSEGLGWEATGYNSRLETRLINHYYKTTKQTCIEI